MSRRNVDVSGLPDHGFGPRSMQWWGTFGFIVIEGAIFGVLIATFLYGMGRVETWPPGDFKPRLLWGALITAFLVGAVVPHRLYQRAAVRQDLRGAKRWLFIACLLEVAILVVRGVELVALEVRWDTNFYGSVLWTILGFHTLHLLSDVVETVVMLLILRRQPATPHAFRDVSENAMYWYFAIVVWLPLFALIYLQPRF